MYDYTYYDYGYDYGYQAASGLAAGFLVFAIIMWIIGIAVSVITIISMWKLFTKAGKPGWAAIIPVYNIIVMLEIAELPMWYIALYFVPGANIYAMIKTYIEVAHKFGKSTGFGVGMALLSPVFLAILAFSKNTNFVGVQNNVQPTYQQPVQQMPNVQPVNPMPEVQPKTVATVMPIVEEVPAQPQVAPVQETVVPPIGPGLPNYEVPVSQPVEQIEESIPSIQPQITPVQENVVPPVVEQQQKPEINQNPVPAFCTNCGNALLPNAKFCTNCGKQI